jgi:hypothetical protein
MVLEKVGGGRTYWPAGDVTRPASDVTRPVGHHLVSYCISQVNGAPPWLYKYPHTGESRHTHTHHILEIPLAKLPFLVY